jgi:hypothetical protein
METLQHLLASLDIFQVIIKSFPVLFEPLFHGLQNLFILIYNSFKHLVELYPGLVSGSVFITLVYGIFSFFRRIGKSRITVTRK